MQFGFPCKNDDADGGYGAASTLILWLWYLVLSSIGNDDIRDLNAFTIGK